MNWGFERGRIYYRKRDINGSLGGQTGGGIVVPRGGSVVVALSYKEGEDEYGYQDRLRPDGVFEYYGTRRVRAGGALSKPNLDIINHVADRRSLLLFAEVTKGKGDLRYLGEWLYGTHRQVQTKGRKQPTSSPVVFELHPLDRVAEYVEESQIPGDDVSLEELRRRAYDAAHSNPDARQQLRNVYERSVDVRNYVLRRAAGKCEGAFHRGEWKCSEEAPFKRKDGRPYLEPHHLHKRSDGGPDHPKFVIALCPTCHRHVHFGERWQAHNVALLERMPLIEV